MRLVTLAACNLNQWAMDFEGNLKRIRESILEAKAKGAKYRLGPELEVPGYGCEDHFLERDTITHSWEVLAEILKEPELTENILVDIGMPVEHQNVLYNCRVICHNQKIILMRPKMLLANDGNYRELRYFTPWSRERYHENHYLPRIITALNGQKCVPFGDCAVAAEDTALGSETCEELWAPQSPHIYLGLAGVEIFTNGSGSHHQLRKLDQRVDLIRSATKKSGGIYMYSNVKGGDGGRCYYDGSSMIFVNGECVAQAPQFSLVDVEVITATVDLDEVRTQRSAVKSRSIQANKMESVPRIDVNFSMCGMDNSHVQSLPREVKYHTPEEELALGPACWLWDYLRRSGAAGYFLPLSGGADSASTAAIVGSMAQLVVENVKNGNEVVLNDVRRMAGDKEYTPTDPRELCSRILHTCYMGTTHSSEETRNRAKLIAEQIGAYHIGINVDQIVAAFMGLFVLVMGKEPKFKLYGGTNAENLALQSLQARIRMVISYFFAALFPWVRGKTGFLLTLGSANVDEALRGYFTKYDCSSADVNPIGSISKIDLKRFLRYGADTLGYPALADILSATPTAELEPMSEDYVQSDEADMGMTYEELSVYGQLRKLSYLGPVSMYNKLVSVWSHLSPSEVATKVKKFFTFYSINRHKMTTLTPSYHAEAYSPDDNRFDHRQIVYNTRWPWQFRKMDELVQNHGGSHAKAS